jgi:hypothetical protein
VIAEAAAISLMFSEVSTATDRLALCLRTQRRIGAAHALLHLRHLVAACLRAGDDSRMLASTLARPLKELDDALATDKLDARAMTNAEAGLSMVRFRLWELERLVRGRRGTDSMRECAAWLSLPDSWP